MRLDGIFLADDRKLGQAALIKPRGLSVFA